MSKAWTADALATRLRAYLADHPDVHCLTVPWMQRTIGRDDHLPPHIVEQAFARLNKTGELALPVNEKRSGCGCVDCRAARYAVRNRTSRKQRAKQRLQARAR